jgi:signal transduction histidine kinase
MIAAQIFSLIALILYVGLMALTLRQNNRRAVNQAFAFYLAAMIFWQFSALVVSATVNPASALLWYRLMTAGMGGQFIFYAFFIQVFLEMRRNRSFIWAGWAFFSILLASSFTGSIIRSVEIDPNTGIFVPTFGLLVPVVGLISYVYLGYSVYNLVIGYKRTKSGIQRNRIKYLLVGASVIALGSFTNLAPSLQGHPVDVGANVVNAIVITYAIQRHQLLDISLVVRKGLFYSIPTVIIGAGYFLLITLAVGTFHISTDTQFVLSLVVAVMAALVAQPLRLRAQYLIDRYFFREKYDSSLMLQRLSHTAAYVLDLDNLARMILDEVTGTIHISKVAFFLKDDASQVFKLTTQTGLDPGSTYLMSLDHPVVTWLFNNEKALSRADLESMPQFKALWGRERRELEELGAELFIPIKAKGELVGIFVLGEKLSQEPYTMDDQLTLTTLANQTAVAIQNAHLYWQLEQTLDALRKAHNELEQRVQERTVDLARANQALQDEVSERLRAEVAIQRYATELERSNQELQQFAYVASHDLQEPLRMVSSYLQLLERRYGEKLEPDGHEFIAFAVDGAKRMQALINDLLAYSRVGTRGKSFEPVSLQTVVEQSKNNLKVAIEENRARIIHNHLPLVQGDATQLAQLFQNLIGNAIKFHGDSPPEIKIDHEERNGICQISISDNGIGIDPQYSERIFLIFQRLHTRDEYPGNGIGLAICKRIIERHAGQIWVKSKPGQGATFFFTLPAVKGAPTYGK